MIYEIIHTSTFKKEFLKLNQKQKNKLKIVLEKLKNNEALEIKYKDHKLKGDMENLRDCHIEPDLVLIYAKDKEKLILTALRINTHSNLGLTGK